VIAGRGSGANGVDFDAGQVDGSGATAVLVSRSSRRLRRELRPLVWMVLEEIALDAVLADGRLIARTSARRLAAGLGLDPGTAAGALRALRQKGVLALERESGVSGRFGLAVYVLQRIEGLAVVTPHDTEPGVKEPFVVQPHMVKSDRVAAVAAKENPARTTNAAAVGASPAEQANPQGAVMVSVVPLGERALVQLVGAMLGADPPSPLVADVLARTDGVPLLVEELGRGHIASGTVGFDDEDQMRWSGGPAKVPGTIRDLVGTHQPKG
jgi:DNA-binding transcriptional ArsR family regulator